MIDLAALTQALERSKPMDFASDLADKQLGFDLLRDAGRLVSRLWQPCQTCNGTGQVEQERRTETETWTVDVTCPSCGGGRVEPTPQAILTLWKATYPPSLPPKEKPHPIDYQKQSNGLLELWRVANEETD